MTTMKNRVLAGILFLTLVGCSRGGSTTPESGSISDHLSDVENLTVYPANVKPSYTFNFTREIRFGNSDEVLIGRPGSIAIDDSGRVFMPDLDLSTINVFDMDGRFLTNIGRDGQGPGEFRSINRLLFHDGQLHVYDVGLRRINTFSLETFEYDKAILFFPDNSGRIENPGGAYPILPIAIRKDGTFLITFLQMRGPYFEPEDPDVDAYHRFYTVSADGRTLQDRIFQQSYSILFPIRPDVPLYLPKPVPFDWMPLWAVFADEYFFSVEQEDFLIKVYDSNGKYLYAFYHPFNRRQLTREELEEVPDNVTPPESWPALNSIMTDDENRLWISTMVDSDEVYEWWVLQETGEVMTKFTWPRDQSIEHVKNGYLYTRETDDEGLVSFVRYRIEIEEN